MKKILVIVAGLVSAAVIGTAVSTLQRYTGINLSNLLSTGSIALSMCLIAYSSKKNTKKVINLIERGIFK